MSEPQPSGPDSGLTPLMNAALNGQTSLVQTLIEAGERVDLSDPNGNQALWFACVSNDPEAVRLILSAGADINHVNETGATALMYAASAGKAHALAALLATGPDLRIELGGLTALDMAASLECLSLLRAADKKARADG